MVMMVMMLKLKESVWVEVIAVAQPIVVWLLQAALLAVETGEMALAPPLVAPTLLLRIPPCYQ